MTPIGGRAGSTRPSPAIHFDGSIFLGFSPIIEAVLPA